MRTTPLAGIGVALVALLAACSAPETPDPVATTSAAPAPTATTTSAPPAEPDPLVACGVLFDGGDDSVVMRIPPALLAVGAKLGNEELAELLAIHESLTFAAKLAPSRLAERITSLNAPFVQVADLVMSGGGSLDMDTSNVAADVTEITTLCADAGYRIG